MRVLRYSLLGALTYKSGSIAYYNYLKPVPEDPQIHKIQNKRIVIVGAGIVGLTTAYYLNKNLGENSQITLIEKNSKCASEGSVQNGSLLGSNSCFCYTYCPITDIIKGLYTYEAALSIYPFKALMEPGNFKFGYYYLLQKGFEEPGMAIFKLCQLSQKLSFEIMNEIGYKAEDINFEPDAYLIRMDQVKDLETKEQLDKYVDKKASYNMNRKVNNFQFMLKEDLREEVTKYYPDYDLERFNFGFKEKIMTFETQKFCRIVDNYLKTKSKVKVLYNAELDEIVFDKHLVKGIKLKNNPEVIECDILVLCMGTYLTKAMLKHFNLTIPIVAVKGYSFDIFLNSTDKKKYHMAFISERIFLTYLNENKWRVSAYADLSDQKCWIDPKRLEMAKTSLKKILKHENVDNLKNLSTCVRPSTPDDLPVLGSLKYYPNVVLNAGHSARGTTTSLSTAKVVSDLIAYGRWDHKDQKKEYLEILDDATRYSPRRFKL